MKYLDGAGVLGFNKNLRKDFFPSRYGVKELKFPTSLGIVLIISVIRRLTENQEFHRYEPDIFTSDYSEGRSDVFLQSICKIECYENFIFLRHELKTAMQHLCYHSDFHRNHLSFLKN